MGFPGSSPAEVSILICAKCGANLADNTQFCSNCETSLLPMQVAPQPAPKPPSLAGPPQTSGKAIASLVCGILHIFPLFVVAIILGHISLSEIKKSSGRLKGEGLALAGLILGYLGIVFIPIILIVAAIAIPNLLRARIPADEAGAVASVRELSTAEVRYEMMHHAAGFSCNFSDLSGLISSDLIAGFKNGYAFFLQGCDANRAADPISKFQITAVPKVPNTTGRRAFCTDETAVIRVDQEGSAESCLDHGPPLE